METTRNRLSMHGGMQQQSSGGGDQTPSRLPQPRRSPMAEHHGPQQPIFAAPHSNRNSVSLPPLSNSTNATSTGLNSSQNAGNGAGAAAGGIDRVNTPGRLRAFFDEMKRSRSVGDPVSIPQKYREMLTEDKKVLRSDSIGRNLADTSFKLAAQRRASVAGNINADGDQDGGATGSHTRRNTVITFGANHAPPSKRSSQVNPDGQGSPGKSPGRNRTQFVLPKPSQDENMEDAEEMEGTSRWQDEGMVDEPAHTQPVDVDKKRAILNRLSERPPVLKINSEDQMMDDEQPEPPQQQQQQPNRQQSQLPRSSVSKPQQPPQPTSKLPAAQSKIAQPVPQKKQAPAPKEVEEEPPKPRAPTPDGMTRCSYCDRSFMSDRVEKHMNVCQQNPAKSQRKVMDGTALRTKGTDFEKSMKRADKSGQQFRPAAKKDWRAQHDQLMATVKAAREPY